MPRTFPSTEQFALIVGRPPPVLGSPLGTTPPSACCSQYEAVFVGEKRVQGAPRGPGGPPHNFCSIRSFGKKYVALGLKSRWTMPRSWAASRPAAIDRKSVV